MIRVLLLLGLLLLSSPSIAQEAKASRPQLRTLDYGVETQLFGVKGKGTRFVYVFDRSASMSDFEGRPLAAAKRELAASLHTLKAVHQFQIIFFNERPKLMNAARDQSPQMIFGDEQGQRQAESFIDTITAEGGTDRMAALRLALRMQPDVIFFLTDADKPPLTAADLAAVERLNRGAIIHAIEFGVGPQPKDGNFLQRLAGANAGEHAYVDVTRLPKP